MALKMRSPRKQNHPCSLLCVTQSYRPLAFRKQTFPRALGRCCARSRPNKSFCDFFGAHFWGFGPHFWALADKSDFAGTKSGPRRNPFFFEPVVRRTGKWTQTRFRGRSIEFRSSPREIATFRKTPRDDIWRDTGSAQGVRCAARPGGACFDQ